MIVELFKKVDNLNRASRGYYSGHAIIDNFTVLYRTIIIAIVNLKMFNLKIYKIPKTSKAFSTIAKWKYEKMHSLLGALQSSR